MYPFTRNTKRKRPDLILGGIFLVLMLSLWTFLEGPNDLAPPPVGIPDAPLGVAPSKTVRIPKDGAPVRFMMYNAHNYFVSEDAKRSNCDQKIKSQESKDALVANIKQISPDIVGLCEIGGREALSDLQANLKKLGLDFPYGVVVEKAGEDRALALLSRYLFENFSQSNVLLLDEKKSMLRGILDVQVKLVDGRIFRILGAHLKSQMSDTNDAVSDSLRRREGMTLRKYLDNIMAEYKGLPILLYGDFNDNPDAPALQALKGDARSPLSMKRLKIADANNETWTIYYDASDFYQAFDQIFVNSVLKSRLGRTYNAGILGGKEYKQASDHRPLWVDLH